MRLLQALLEDLRPKYLPPGLKIGDTIQMVREIDWPFGKPVLVTLEDQQDVDEAIAAMEHRNG